MTTNGDLDEVVFKVTGPGGGRRQGGQGAGDQRRTRMITAALLVGFAIGWIACRVGLG